VLPGGRPQKENEKDMAYFIIRVQLSEERTHADYGVLHRAMEDAKYMREIKADDGTFWHLLHAEYFFEGEATIEQVHARANEILSGLGFDGAVFVARAEQCLWNNLEPLASDPGKRRVSKLVTHFLRGL
jgi:hypothetical protein